MIDIAGSSSLVLVVYLATLDLSSESYLFKYYENMTPPTNIGISLNYLQRPISKAELTFCVKNDSYLAHVLDGAPWVICP
jgi:hypothetical protein